TDQRPRARDVEVVCRGWTIPLGIVFVVKSKIDVAPVLMALVRAHPTPTWTTDMSHRQRLGTRKQPMYFVDCSAKARYCLLRAVRVLRLLQLKLHAIVY